jgi:rod shape determining protein RodA
MLVAVALGAAMLYSATLRGGPADSAWNDLVVKQLVFACVGLLVLFLVAITEYHVLLALWPWVFGVTVALLLGVFLLGTVLGGSLRWYSLGAVLVQPSELSKLSLVLCLAAYFQRHDVRQMRHVLVSLAMAAALAVLVYLQPNLSTAVLIGFIWLGVVLAAGMRPLHLSVLALAAAPVITFTFNSGLIKPYQLDRIRALLDPSFDPLRAGYQNIQTLLAVGNGGLTGTGFASGLQSQGGWLPLLYTDNIYALVSEELGFVGGTAVLLLLAFIVWRVLRAARMAQDRAGALIALGVAVYLLAQTFINVGVVLQILPVTGLSLPLLSYGGSSLLTVMAAIGLVQSVLLRRKPLDFR